jgi:transposase-like protein
MFYIGEKSVSAHRFAYQLLIGSLPRKPGLDHTCRNKCCVNPNHLRFATHKQNGENRGLNCNNTSGVRGVSWDKKRQLWKAVVVHDGTREVIGCFRNIRDAEIAVVAKRNELYTHNILDRENPLCHQTLTVTPIKSAVGRTKGLTNAEIEERWQRIVELSLRAVPAAEIAHQLGISERSVFRIRRQRLGPRTPRRGFTDEEVELVEAMLVDGASIAEIARTIGRCPATVRKRWPGRSWDKIACAEFGAFMHRIHRQMPGY